MQEIAKGFQIILEYLKEIKSLLQTQLKLNRAKLLKEEWVDGQDISLTLHISQRRLRYLRDSGQLPFTTLDEKFYYRYSDIDAILEKNYFKKHPINK